MKNIEYLDVVDESDQVISQAAYTDIYRKLLTHRIVHILIFNDKGEMAIQKRSKHKSFMPNAWSTAVGGHVRSGETSEQAALREFREELGLEVPIQFLYKDFYEDNAYEVGLRKFLYTFKAVCNGPFALDQKEVESIDYFTFDKIKEMIARREKFHPELLFLLKKYYNIE